MEGLAITDRSLIEAEALDLARLSSAAYRRYVAYYQQECGHSAKDADALARAPLPSAADAPSHDLSWHALNTLIDSDPQLAVAVWERVKADAAGYVAQGSHIGDALHFDSPWQKAQLAVIRRGFYEEWQPRGGVECSLLDSMAMAYCAHLYWVAQTQERALSDPTDIDRARRKDGYWVAPRVSQAEALDQAAGMADRFNRIMIRTLRALRDLRRFTVVVNGAQQVNIGGQQVIAGRVEER